MKISFGNKNPAFSIALKKKVDGYFAAHDRKLTGNRHLYWKTGILLGSATVFYVLMLLHPAAWVSLLCFALLGLSLAVIGFNVMHDGAHGSYSGKGWVNEIMAYSLNLMGGNSYLWKQKHNLMHHSFTNIESHDEDITIPFMRTHRSQPKRSYHRFQHLYSLPLYTLTYISLVYVKNFREYFTCKIGAQKSKKMNLKEHTIFWFSKLAYLFLFIGLPALVLGFWKAMLGYLIMAMVCGFVLGVVFQLAHVVEETDFPLPDDETQRIGRDWTIHQLATTANFSTNSKVISWLLGGLNFQVEHHLFPRISHVHYPGLSLRVKEVCAEYGVQYIEHPNLLRALRSHVAYLKMVGNQ